MSLLNCSLSGCVINKIINDVVEYFVNFLQSIHSIRFQWRLSIDTATRVELCACTSDRKRSTRAGEACTSDRQSLSLLQAVNPSGEGLTT